MGKKFVLEFDIGLSGVYGDEIGYISGCLMRISRSDLAGAFIEKQSLHDIDGNTIGHFEIVETDESEG